MCTAPPLLSLFFFFNDTATTEIYTLSLHDALPIYQGDPRRGEHFGIETTLHHIPGAEQPDALQPERFRSLPGHLDRKSTRLNSSHLVISYAVFCLKKKKQNIHIHRRLRDQAM